MTSDNAPKTFLLNARMADLLRRPASVEAERLVDELLAITLEAETRKGGKPRKRRDAKALASLRATIGALVHDLLHAQLNESAQGFCYLSSRDSARFKGTAAALRPYNAVKDLWQRVDLLEVVKGLNHGFSFDEDLTEWPEGKLGGKAARLRAQAPLIVLAARNGIRPDNLRDHFRVSHDDSYPVMLAKRPLRHRTEESDAIAEKVRLINQGLERHSFDPPIRPRLYAGFQEDLNRPGELVWGGRLYAQDDGDSKAAQEDPQETQGFQQWPEAKRLQLLIDGEPVAEVDIKASHLTIYHALLGIALPRGKDPYEVPGVPRELVKHVVTVFFGKGNVALDCWPKLRKEPKNAAIRAARKGRKAEDVARRVVEAIPALQKLPRSGLGWGELQKAEAGILLDVMAWLRELEGIPMLPVHDSLIVPERHVPRVLWALRHRFHGVTGVYPTLTISRQGQPEEVWTKEAADGVF